MSKRSGIIEADETAKVYGKKKKHETDNLSQKQGLARMISSTTSQRAIKYKKDEMRELYKKAKDSMHHDGLKKENLLNILNVILGRKGFKMTVC